MNTEIFEHFQPLGSNDPAYTGVGIAALGTDTPAFTPLMIDIAKNALVAWDGKKAGGAVGLLALPATQADTKITYYKCGTWRADEIHWPDGITEVLKFNAFAGTSLSVV